MAYAWLARHDLSSTQYQTETETLLAQGFRPIDVSAYNVNGVDFYAAVWEQSPGPDWIARHTLSHADHQDLFTTLPGQGFRPVSVSGCEVATGVRYASIWHKITGPAWRARHGLTAAELQAEFDALTPQGFRPVDVCGYTVAGEPRFAAIWEQSSMQRWEARHNLTAAEYQSEFTRLSNEGLLLLRVSAHDVGGEVRYAAIWVQGGPLTWLARHGVQPVDYQTEASSFTSRGYRLVKVNAHRIGAEVRFSSIWHKPYLSDAEESFIRDTVTAFMNDYGVPGLSLALSVNGRLVLAEAFGLADRATGGPVTPSHLFRIASVSKPITAVAVFRLIEAGQLDLGRTIFGPNGVLGTTFGTPTGDQRIENITVQHLLEHTSGWSTLQDPMFQHFDLDQHQLISLMLGEVLAHAPGTIHEYLNFGYLVLGRVIEQVSGMAYADYVRQSVLAPCGISDMHIAGNTLAERRPNEVVYYSPGPSDPYAIQVARMDAHGGWIASAPDLVRFLVHVDGFATKPDILTSTSLATMSTPTSARRPNGEDPLYAKGWMVTPAGHRWHDGDLAGSVTILVRTSNELCWAALTNSRVDARKDEMVRALDDMVWTVVRHITDWPAFDRF